MIRKSETQRAIEQIREAENSFCNPMKLKHAQELRQDLEDRGYSKREIDEMVDD